MWKKLLLGMLALVVALAGAVATTPTSYRVERSTVVAAPPAVLQAALTDLQRWIAWSPREARDPKIVRRYGGPRAGTGASYYWSGNASVGRGRMTVVGAGTDHVEVELEMEQPTHSSADLEFRLAPEGTGTRVTWTVIGEIDLVDRALWFLAGRRGATAADMEVRLGQLKAAAEALARVPVHRMERTTFVAAPPEAVRARIADLRSWTRWSPWKGSGSGTASYGGPASGAGSSLYWSGGDAGGRGRITIVAVGQESVEVEVERGVPHAASNDLEFRISPEEKGARVTWTMTGDGGLGVADLEQGLASLKALSEARVR